MPECAAKPFRIRNVVAVPIRGRLSQKLRTALRRLSSWLSGMDSNHDKGLQRALCYHYTTGQTAIS